jgi:hypothetical protein
MQLVPTSWENYSDIDWTGWILELIYPDLTIPSAITKYEKTPSGRLDLFPTVFPGYVLPISLQKTEVQTDPDTGRLYFTLNHYGDPLQYCLIPPIAKAASSEKSVEEGESNE